MAVCLLQVKRPFPIIHKFGMTETERFQAGTIAQSHISILHTQVRMLW